MVQELRAVTFQFMEENRAPFWMPLWNQTAPDPFIFYQHEGSQADDRSSAHLPLSSTMPVSTVDLAKQHLRPEPSARSSLFCWRNQRLGGREASWWGGSFHHCPLLQKNHKEEVFLQREFEKHQCRGFSDWGICRGYRLGWTDTEVRGQPGWYVLRGMSNANHLGQFQAHSRYATQPF